MPPVKIFITYARNDDSLPDDCEKGAKGFVTRLHEELEWEFKAKGPPAPILWRDRREIEPANQFDEKIAEAISESAILLVILSRNWLSRPWCREELDRFAKRWSSLGPPEIKKRIVVVRKNFVDDHAAPHLLQGQESYKFFSLRDGDGPGKEEEFYYRGARQDSARYVEQVQALARFLWTEARRLAEPPTAKPAPAIQAEPVGDVDRRRKIYVAKPAKDMLRCYCRLVEELQRRDFAVLPAGEIPQDDSAKGVVREALAQAEISVHLLGEGAGPQPEDCKPLVQLQLDEASERTASKAAATGARPFNRIIWAPKILDDPSASPPAAARNPFDVLKRFGAQLPTDKVESETLTGFIDFLLDHLLHTAETPKTFKEVASGARVYMYYVRGDQDYVLQLAEMLARHPQPVSPVDRVFEGPDDQVAAHHRRMLAECDAVLLIWARASEVWIRAHADELRDWRGIGRNQPFLYRGVVAAPPPGDRKKSLVRLPPASEVDIVLDLQAVETLTPQLLDPLVPAARP